MYIFCLDDWKSTARSLQGLHVKYILSVPYWWITAPVSSNFFVGSSKQHARYGFLFLVTWPQRFEQMSHRRSSFKNDGQNWKKKEIVRWSYIRIYEESKVRILWYKLVNLIIHPNSIKYCFYSYRCMSNSVHIQCIVYFYEKLCRRSTWANSGVTFVHYFISLLIYIHI